LFVLTIKVRQTSAQRRPKKHFPESHDTLDIPRAEKPGIYFIVLPSKRVMAGGIEKCAGVWRRMALSRDSYCHP
jgi:hypothetical protein